MHILKIFWNWIRSAFKQLSRTGGRRSIISYYLDEEKRKQYEENIKIRELGKKD